MPRYRRLIFSITVITSENSIHNFSVRLLAGMFFLIVGIVAARASTLPNAKYNHEAISERLDVHDISYRVSWLQSLRLRAEQAMKQHAPYLARRLWQQLAEAGDRDAAYRLGLLYDTGDAQVRDARLAVYWYRRAALAGEIHAQHNLGVAYARGDGVALDINEAIKWWTLAARRGNSDSQYNLGILYAAGEYGIKQDFEQARHWWQEAAIHGDPMAQYNLGTLYVNNEIHDYCQAAYWWQEAAKSGVEKASLALRVIKTRKDYHACH